MRNRHRLNEAIKQTEIVLENIDHHDTRQKLEQGLNSLNEGLKLLDQTPG